MFRFKCVGEQRCFSNWVKVPVLIGVLALPLAAFSQTEPGSLSSAGGASDGPLPVAPQIQQEDGFVWHSNGAGSATYAGDGTDFYRYNPTGEDIVVTRTGTGSYTVEPSDSPNWFLPTVTAYTDVGNFCTIEYYDWVDAQIEVRCWDPAGNAVDEEFSLRWTATTEDAYAWISTLGDANCCQNNSWGAPITATNPSIGKYVVTTPGGANFQGGHIQVSAYGLSPNHCKVDVWAATTAEISCYDTAGAPVNNAFTFLRIGSPDDAYAWADDPSSTTEYTTDPFWSHNPQGNADPVSIKTGTGAYTVTFPDLRHAYGGNVLVSAYGGTDAVKCSIRNWGSQSAVVRCHDGGTPEDSRFDVLYTRFITCNDKVVTVDLYEGQTTGPGDDVVSGTDGDDDIRGKAGQDTICGRGGDDFIHGNSDNDWIDGGAGVDNLRGGQGDDIIYTGPGATVGVASRAFGGYGQDTMYGGADADDLRGGRGDDVIFGGGGNDEITGNEDNDYIDGEAGDDIVKGGNGESDELYGSTGADELNGGSGSSDFCDAGGDVGDTTTGCELF